MPIRLARTDDLVVLQHIEVAAGLAFRDVGMAEVASDAALPVAELARFQAANGAWLAVGSDDRPIAYLLALEVDESLHVEQVSVHPDHARRGVGRALLDHLAVTAADAGFPALTLTTFVDVPWNAPYYARCGFHILVDDQVTPGLRAIRRHEAELGLDRWPRVCMRRPLSSEA